VLVPILPFSTLRYAGESPIFPLAHDVVRQYGVGAVCD